MFDLETGDDVETLMFVLYNRSGWTVGFNPYDWGIERYELIALFEAETAVGGDETAIDDGVATETSD